LRVTRITSGPVDIIASGIVTSFQKNPIEVTVRTIKIVFELKDDKENKEPSIIRKVSLPDKTVRITLFNFTGPLGVGTIRPIPLGILLNDRRVYFHVRAYSIGSSDDKTLQYTVYQARETIEAEQAMEAEQAREAEQAKEDG
jgi:hypothetical protein